MHVQTKSFRTTICIYGRRLMVKKSFDPKKIDAIFTLTSSVKDNILAGALNAAMANMVKALQFYIGTPMLKKERDYLEEEFYDLLVKISMHPKFASTYGPVSFRQGEHSENIDFMKQLIKFGAENLQEKIDQGIELLAADRMDEAKTLFFEVLDDPDADLQHYMTIGDTYLKKHMWKEAQEVFARAMAKDPESLHILNRAAIAFRKGKEYEKALSIYRDALMLSPKDEGLYYNAARLFMDMGKMKSAGQALQKALAINPKFKQAAMLLNNLQETMAARKAPPKEQG